MEKIKLPSSEWKIITTLWENEPMTITELTAALREETGWSKSTVITLLKRMEEKGAVTYEQTGGARSYRALVRREDVAVSETRDFLKRLYRGSIGMMISMMIERKALSDEEINELYDILKKAKK